MSPRAGLDLNAVLQAATEIADTYGLDALTLAALAKRLGIRSPSLYNHVDGLPGLRKKLGLHALGRLHQALTRAAVGRSGDEAVQAVAAAYVRFAREHPGLYEATFVDDADVRQAGGPVLELVLQIMSAYKLEGDAAVHAVRGLRSLLHGFASLEQKGGFGIPLDADESLRLLIATFIAGMQALASTGR
ncbi:MAG TPA: TetR-like C-terminal domain-containing protein [Limnochordia bacterium]|nr:TetR-like C-terminal domain-containing protein [Limnochordia bacterium]